MKSNLPYSFESYLFKCNLICRLRSLHYSTIVTDVRRYHIEKWTRHRNTTVVTWFSTEAMSDATAIVITYPSIEPTATRNTPTLNWWKLSAVVRLRHSLRHVLQYSPLTREWGFQKHGWIGVLWASQQSLSDSLRSEVRLYIAVPLMSPLHSRSEVFKEVVFTEHVSPFIACQSPISPHPIRQKVNASPSKILLFPFSRLANKL